jgi:predicted SnoaL-like aldol condensation-catalyzing enzyme
MTAMADPQANKALVREVFDRVINGRDPALAARYYAPDYIQHNPRVAAGLAGLQALLSYLFAAFEDLFGDLTLVLAEGDLVMALVDWRGTQTGPFAGRPASGRQITFRSAEIFRIQDGLLVEHWDAVENTEMMVALGALIPAPQNAAVQGFSS